MGLSCKMFTRLVICYIYLIWPACFFFLWAYYYFCVLYLVNITSAANLSTQMICLPMQNGTNLKVGKEAIERNDPLPLRKPLMRKILRNETVPINMIMNRSTPVAFQALFLRVKMRRNFLRKLNHTFLKMKKAKPFG